MYFLILLILSVSANKNNYHDNDYCVKNTQENKILRFAWLANDPANPYDTAILQGAQDILLGRKKGRCKEALITTFFAGFDPAVQLKQCLRALKSRTRYDGLFILPASPEEILPCVSQAYKRRIPVVAVDIGIGPDPNVLDPKVRGIVGASFIPPVVFGDALQDILPQLCENFHPCSILYVGGLSTFPPDEFGIQAISTFVNSTPDTELINVTFAAFDSGLAQTVVSENLELHNINVIITSADQMAAGAEIAAIAAGKTPGSDLLITGAGAGSDAIEAVRTGRWFATLNTLPRTEGRISAKLMIAAIKNPKIEPRGVDPVAASGLPRMWTAETLEDFPDFVAEW